MLQHDLGSGEFPSLGSLIFRNGVIHSRSEPYATAFGVEGGHITWLGSEGLAQVRGEGASVPHIDLGGALVCPAFTSATTAGNLLSTEYQSAAAQLGIAYLDDVDQLSGRIANPLEENSPLAQWQANGEVFGLGSPGTHSPVNPWSLIRAAILQANHGLTARAAFNSMTRTGHRLAGRDLSGELATGAPATFAIHATDTLTVQTPSSQAQAWSTDVRAGTPLLPELSLDANLPVCLMTVRDGVALFRGDAV